MTMFVWWIYLRKTSPKSTRPDLSFEASRREARLRIPWAELAGYTYHTHHITSSPRVAASSCPVTHHFLVFPRCYNTSDCNHGGGDQRWETSFNSKFCLLIEPWCHWPRTERERRYYSPGWHGRRRIAVPRIYWRDGETANAFLNFLITICVVALLGSDMYPRKLCLLSISYDIHALVITGLTPPCFRGPIISIKVTFTKSTRRGLRHQPRVPYKLIGPSPRMGGAPSSPTAHPPTHR